MAKFVRYTDEDWSALYMDGKLVASGDHYLIEQWMENYLGVENREGDAFLRGTNRDVAELLEDVEAFEMG